MTVAPSKRKTLKSQNPKSKLSKKNDFVAVVDKVSKVYHLDNIEVRALKNVSLKIPRGRFCSIIGPSGSGKSTMLNLLGGIDYPTDGKIIINDQDLSLMDDNQLSSFRAHEIGFIFQSFNLIPVLNVFENVEYPLLLKKNITDKMMIQEKVMQMIEAVGLLAYAHHRPNELSGGQRQRVAIARALVTQPAMVLADEPTANLDSKTGEAILKLMHNLNDKYHTTFVFSTHDPVVMSHAEEKWELKDGEVIHHVKKK